MKKILYFIFCLLAYSSTYAQCPPGDLEFYYQLDIDVFLENYPNCTMISGDLIINSPEITNLNGLSNITSIGGDLDIVYNYMTNVDGLANLTSIGGRLYIADNEALTNVNGLANLTSIGGNLGISGNPMLASCCGVLSILDSGGIGGNTNIGNNLPSCNSPTEISVFCENNNTLCPTGSISLNSQADVDAFLANYPNCTMISGNLEIGAAVINLNGLSNIISVGLNLTIFDNNMLADVDGLTMLNSIGGSLVIEDNDLLANIDGLINLTSVGNNLIIDDNSVLSNINGLSNITSVGYNFFVQGNIMLVDCCEVFPLLNNEGVGNITVIDNNLPNCNSQTEIFEACGEPNDTLPPCPTGNLNLSSQADVDAFLANYPDCTDFSESLQISGVDITNLNGLNNLASIGGSLTISNTMLTNLNGFENLTSIGGSLDFSNTILTNLNGLDNLISIGGELTISNTVLTNLDGLDNLTSIGGGLTIQYNSMLVNIDGLSNLTSIGIDLIIDGNSMLTNLDGLANLTFVGDYITIAYNSMLSECCAIFPLLASGDTGGSIFIDNPGTSCDKDEILQFCGESPPYPCPISGISLNSQVEVDNFLVDFPDCTMISGNLTINGNDITNLDGLANITTIEGSLSIQSNDMLSNIDGLVMLNSVEGSIIINYNDLLTNVDGLINLSSIGGSLSIGPNDILNNIDGLINLASVGSSAWTSISISNNPMLADCCGIFPILDEDDGNGNIDFSDNLSGCNNKTEIFEACQNPCENDNTPCPTCPTGNVDLDSQADVDNFLINYPNCTMISGNLKISGFNSDFDITNLDGLLNLTSVAGEVIITYNPNLSNIDGLSNLTSIGGLSVGYNSILSNIDGLSNLTSIELGVSIFDNAALSNIDGLSNLISVEGDGLSIINNNALINIDGLSNVTYVEGELAIVENDLLAICCGIFPLLTTGTVVPGDIVEGIFIENNLPGCNSQIEVEACGEVANAFSLSLKVYLEGAYDAEIGEMQTLANVHLPLTQPYNNAPYNYIGTESVTTMPTNVVDWILVEIRVGVPSLTEKATTVVETKAGLLLNTGDIVGMDGVSTLRFDSIVEGNAYYICIRHRNHMDVLSAYPIIAQNNMSYNFTNSISRAFGASQQTLLVNGKAALFVGDYNQDNIIQVTDLDAWEANPAQVNTYSLLDGTLDGVVQVTDLDAWILNKAKVGIPEIGF